MPSNRFKPISKRRLYQRKVQGCCREFGVKETFHRAIHEFARLFKKYDDEPDISQITEKLFIGAAPRSMKAINRLKELGFRHIIDLRAERKETDILVITKEISVQWVPIYDDWRPKPSEFFQNLMAEINTVLWSKSCRKLLLCCGAGGHRAPLSGVLALTSMGHSLESSIVMIQRARPVAELLPVYTSSLKDFLRE